MLYIPAGKAGWVIDAAGFLYNLKHQHFWDFINRTTSTDQSFYQVLTFHYFLFYKIWGMNMWLWSLLYITLHSVNAFLLYCFARNILSDSGYKKTLLIPLAGVVMFTMSPHISEIIICKAYYHYLQCFLFILAIMLLAQKYQHQQKTKYIWVSLLLFVLASMTLEIFYLIPFFILCIALYYRYLLNYDKTTFRKTILYFFLPQLLLLVIYFLALVARYRQLHPHKLEINQTAVDYLSKLPKYVFHILFFGRYFSIEFKRQAYVFCASTPALITVYSILALVFLYIIARFRKMKMEAKAMSFFFTLSVMTICFLIPLPFPEPELLIFYDRYTYFADAFIYILLALIIARFVKNRYVNVILFCIYLDCSLYFTIVVNTYWMESDSINNKLLRHFPNPGNKKVLLLNIPENMNGAPMIGAQPDGMFKIMREIYTDTVEPAKIYDVASYNIAADYDGAHVEVLNDGVLRVTLNHFGNWWWYEGHGAKSYENADYKLNMRDMGHWYDLSLKHPADEYLILYSVGDKWKIVDFDKKNVVQE